MIPSEPHTGSCAVVNDGQLRGQFIFVAIALSCRFACCGSANCCDECDDDVIDISEMILERKSFVFNE